MKIRFHIKGQDDAIDEQGEVISKVTQSLDDFMRDFDRMLNTPTEQQIEFNVSLSDNSPFKKLQKKDLINKKIVDKTWAEFPRFMYLPEEVELFQEEYNKILIEMPLAIKRFVAKSLSGTLGYVKALPDDKKTDQEILTKFKDRIVKLFRKFELTVRENVANARTMDELVIMLEKIIQELKV